MILNTNQINKLKKLNTLPKQEKFRANWNKEDFYGDRYHNCADHYYGLGANNADLLLSDCVWPTID